MVVSSVNNFRSLYNISYNSLANYERPFLSEFLIFLKKISKKILFMAVLTLTVSSQAQCNIHEDSTLLFNRLQMTYLKPSNKNNRLRLNSSLLDFSYQKKAAKMLAKRSCANYSTDLDSYLHSMLRPSMVYVEFMATARGWLAGNPFLSSNSNWSLGVKM